MFWFGHGQAKPDVVFFLRQENELAAMVNELRFKEEQGFSSFTA